MTPADRKLLAAAGVLMILIVAGGFLFAPSPDDENPVPSTYSSGSGGARAAYLLLSELGSDVRRWEESPAMLPNPGRGALLILGEPADPPSKADVASLRRFVSSGGRVLFCGARIGAYFQGSNIGPVRAGLSWQEFTPSFPSYLARDARTIVMQPQASWKELAPSQLALYGQPDAAVIVDWHIGEGVVLWWASATPLTNAGITREGNLNLFLNSVGAAGDEAGPIFWDEYFHGQRRSLWTYFEATPLKFGLAQFGLLAMLVLFTFSRRSGPIVPAAAVSRLSPLEFVDTMGGLYERAGAASVPVSVCYRRFRFELARRLGLPVTATDGDLADAAGSRLGLPAENLVEALEAASAAAEQRKLASSRALDLVRTLEDFRAQLAQPFSLNKNGQENH